LPKIAEEIPYNGVYERAQRLGLVHLLDELRELLTNFALLVKEETDSNGGKRVRELIDSQFRSVDGWVKGQSLIDWTKCITVNGTKLCVGVEIQVSGRSDSGLVMDIIHLRRAISKGDIDVGVIVAPTDELADYLTDRAPSIKSAKMHVEEAKAEDLPLLLISLAHDGAGPPLPKQAKRSRKA